jgi:hypothetical protein
MPSVFRLVSLCCAQLFDADMGLLDPGWHPTSARREEICQASARRGTAHSTDLPAKASASNHYCTAIA